MKRRLLLTGAIGCGKSTLIINALGGAIQNAGGFLTLRVMENGRLAGFDLCSVDGKTRERFLSFGPGGAVRDERPFTETAPALLRQAQAKKFALIDETGGFELLCSDFYEALTAFLFSGKPCVGVLKALPGAEELARRVPLPPGYLGAARRRPGHAPARDLGPLRPERRGSAPALGRGIRAVNKIPLPAHFLRGEACPKDL